MRVTQFDSGAIEKLGLVKIDLLGISALTVMADCAELVRAHVPGFELDSIAAVVIGGTSLSGGRGSVLKTVLGCLIIGVLNSGLVQLGVSPFWQPVDKGVVIIAAVALDRLNRREE